MLPYGLCGRCDLVDVVLDPTRPRCRVCDPRLAGFLAEREAAQIQGDAPDAVPMPAPLDLPADPTGRDWAA